MGKRTKSVVTSDGYYRFILEVNYKDAVAVNGSAIRLVDLFSANVRAYSLPSTPLDYRGFRQGRVRLPIKVTSNLGNSSVGQWCYRDETSSHGFESKLFDAGNDADNAEIYSLQTIGEPVIATSAIFNTSNKTSRTAILTYPLDTTAYLAVSQYKCWDDPPSAGSEGHDGNQSVATILTTDTWGSGGVNIGTTTVTLTAPPTFTASQMSFDTNYVYAGYTRASITISNATAYYGGDIVNATLTIGSQSASITGNGTLSIALANAGTFTPTVSVTDSRGQTVTRQLSQITVLERQNPSCTVNVDRVIASNGKYVINDEGANAVITMSNITWSSAVATLDTPTVTVTDRNQQTSSPTVTWYANWADDGTLSNQITNWTTYTGTTAYGLITNSFDVQYAYTFKVTPRDKDVKNVNHSGTVVTFQLPSAYYTVDFLAGGHGIAFGAFATREGFYCEMDAMFGNDVFLDIDTTSQSGTDHDLYTAIYDLGWWDDVNVNV